MKNSMINIGIAFKMKKFKLRKKEDIVIYTKVFFCIFSKKLILSFIKIKLTAKLNFPHIKFI